MTDKIDLHGNCIMGDECGNLSALRDHYQTLPEQCCAKCGSLRLEPVDGSALPDAKEAEIAETRSMLLDLLAVIHRDGGHKTHEIGRKLAWEQAMQLSSERIAERDEALARAEWAEQALADRDAAIVEAVPLLQLLRSKLSIPDEINALLARLDALLPASEPVSDPLVDVYEQIRESIRGFSAAEFANDLRAALAARGGKVVFGEVDHD